eukprot:TRINITY_DN1907_c0_g1_i1.p1 TRINITY_DN1907_c0_g1~~TRINITY_DN1907_c0_g1_i1.p1  ORF type:complete len:272 (-),score=32.60 TRINITY_DN1907_c0_g1_i1:142-957(-)
MRDMFRTIQEEYKEIIRRTLADQINFSTSLKYQNLNRYQSVLAIENTRVLVHDSCGESDYINANFVSSPSKQKNFIACQAPLPNSFDTFWRMVWDQQSRVVIMLTDLVESGDCKADQYWPNAGFPVLYDNSLLVTYREKKNIVGVNNIIIREFRVTCINTNTSRNLYQIQYIGWPDHNVPNHPQDVLTLIHTSQHFQTEESGPIIVHCSAGIGRTGTLIAVYNCIQFLDLKGHCKINDVVERVRKERYGSVTTVDQYRFIYQMIHYVIRVR